MSIATLQPGGRCLGGALLAAFITPAVAAGGLVYQHTGINNPASEGWTPFGAGVSVTTGSAMPIAAAWFVNDQGTTDDSTRWYRIEPTAKEAADALAEGWVLRACLEVVQLTDDVDSSIFLEYRDGTRTFSLQIGSENGSPLVEVIDNQGKPACDSWSGPSFLISTEGGCLEQEFHVYEMRYDPGADAVSVSVDGAQILGGFTGFTPTGSQAPRIEFGSAHGCRTGHARYAAVQFEIGVITCPWDCGATPDELVGINDLLAMLGSWGGPGPCDFDGGGTGINDLLELLTEWGPCPTSSGCGSTKAGSCYVAGPLTGCDNVTCCGAVCDSDPSCCDIAWDANCVTLALGLCADCGEPDAGDCCVGHETQGCNDAACCEAMCVTDSFCCNFTWDELCAEQAASNPACNCP